MRAPDDSEETIGMASESFLRVTSPRGSAAHQRGGVTPGSGWRVLKPRLGHEPKNWGKKKKAYRHDLILRSGLMTVTPLRSPGTAALEERERNVR